MRFALCSLATILLTFQLTLAQSSNQGAVAGTITDEAKSVMPGVEITVTDLKTGVSRTAASNQQGDYKIDFLIPGKYQVAAERAGFQKATISDVAVQVGTVTRLDLSLRVGDISEAVVVSSAAAGVDTETPVLGEVIDNAKIQALPLNGREFLQLASLVPGAVAGNTKRGAADPGPQGNLAISFSGARSNQNAYFIDGADSRAPDYGQIMASPALDAIKEFRVETNLYSAQYGRAGGGVINIVTNSGTNDFHGTLYEYHRNKILDAAPLFDHRPYENRAPYLFNQYGGSIGGPIFLPKFGEGGPSLWSGRGKSFFFLSAERFREKKPGSLIQGFGPTARERAGDFSQSINPFTGQPVVLRNPYTRAIIPSGILPPELITPVGRKLMSLFPDPNYAGDQFLNYRIYRSGTNNQDKWLGRIDHHFNSRNTLSGTYNFSEYAYTSVGMTPFGDHNTVSKDKTLVLTYTRVFTNTLVNEFTFNVNRYNSGRDFTLNDKNYGTEWGVFNHQALGSPRILLYTQGFAVSTVGNDGAFLRDNKHTFIKNNLAWVNGRHTLKIGGEFKRQNYLWMYDSGFAAHLIGLGEGDPGYSDYYDATGYSWATLLTGLATYSYIGIGDGGRSPMSRTTFGFYGQDEWKVTPRLTLSLGLRWDYDPPFQTDDNKFLTLNFETGKPRYAAGAPADQLALVNFPYETGGPNRPYEPKKTDFAPRVGFAYRLFNDNSTVLRGGYGISYATETAFTTTYGAWAVPFGGLYYYRSRGYFWPDGQDRFFRIDQAPPEADAAFGASPGFSQLQDPYYPSTYFQQWNLTLSRSMGRRLAVEVAYVGSKGTNLNGTGGLYDISDEFNNKVLTNAPGWSVTLMRKGYNSNYHSLQAKARQDLSRGLSFLAAYTWGHALAEASNESINENSIRETDLLGTRTTRRYSNADFDVRHRFSLAGSYELPLGRNKPYGSQWHPVVNGILGNWVLNYIYAFQTGLPYSVRTPSLAVPNRICDGALPKNQRTTDRWYDTSCFVPPTPNTITSPTGQTVIVNSVGNAGANIIRGPSTNNVDLGVHKNFQFSEQRRLEFRFETFNTFNHPQFLGPQGSATYFLTSATGARLTTVRSQRSIQLALKFIF